MSKSDTESGNLSGKTIGVGRRLHCALDVFSDVSVTASLMLIILIVGILSRADKSSRFIKSLRSLSKYCRI